MTKTLLIIAHTPSPNTIALREAAVAGASDPAVGDVSVRHLSPFDVQVEDVQTADAVIIGTTENIGYMAGATKDMFDRCYNDWLGHTDALPVALYIRAGLDGTATKRALISICGAQKWRLMADTPMRPITSAICTLRVRSSLSATSARQPIGSARQPIWVTPAR